MHQIKRTYLICYNLSQKNLKYFCFLGMHSAVPSPLSVLLQSVVWESLRRGRQGKLTECPYFFIPQCWLFLSPMCEIFILSWLGILKIKMYRWLQKDFWQFSKEFWTLLKMSEDVPANFESFQSYLKVTIFACFVYGTLKLLFSAIIHCRDTIFPGL